MPEPKVVELPEDDTQDHAYLGREFLAWLLFRLARGEAVFEDDAGEIVFAFGGRLRVSGPAGDVTDAVLKGRSPAASVELMASLGAGRSIREAELRVIRGEREFRFTLVAETLDWKGVKLPSLLKDEGDDRLGERLALLEELESSVREAFGAFLRERTRPVWIRSVLPEMREWLAENLKVV
jgi:hypothetical protein